MSPRTASAGSSRAAWIAEHDEDPDFDALVADVLFREDGKLVARFHDHGIKAPFRFDHLTEKMSGEAADAIAAGYVVWANESETLKGRYNKFNDLRYGLGDFLHDREGEPLELADLTAEFVAKFEAALLARHPNARKRRSKKLAALRNVVERIALLERWADRLPVDIQWPPDRRAIGAPRKTRNKALSAADYDALWVAASRKSKKLIALHERRKAALATWRGRVPTPSEAIDDPVALAVLLAHEDPKGLPPLKKVRKGWRRRITNNVWRRAHSILAPDIGELVPAILILSIVFGLNPGVVEGMRHKLDYDEKPGLGRMRLFISPLKARSRSKPQRNSVVSTEDGDNPARVIRFVEERTAFLRERSGPPHAELLFLWRSHLGVHSFAGSGASLQPALATFGRRSKVTGLQLRKIRPSSLDRVHEITGGDLIKVRDYANHESIQTTFTDYETDAIAQRDVEALGRAMRQNDRFLASGGVIRPFLLSPELDKGSATPGYACLDPERSAIPGEADGVLCKAYGRCPICPLAAIHRTPRGYAYLQALVARIDEALTEELVRPKEWIGRWAIVKKSVAIQLLAFPVDVIEASGDVAISPLPPLE